MRSLCLVRHKISLQEVCRFYFKVYYILRYIYFVYIRRVRHIGTFTVYLGKPRCYSIEIAELRESGAV